MVAFENPRLLLLIPAALIVLLLIIRKDFVKLKGERWQQFEKAKVKKRLLIFALRSIAVTALIIALAQPVALRQEIAQGDPSLTILLDSSKSFDLFDRTAVDLIKSELEGELPVRVRAIGSPERSAIGDEVLASMLGNDNLLLVSDGRVTSGRSLGDVMVVASAINSTISSLYLEPVRTDLAVRVEGPRVTTVGIDNEFQVRVDQTGPKSAPAQNYRVKVELDGETVLEKSASGTDGFRLTRKLGEGYHKIKAEIELQDYFAENNVFYKSVKVEKKPRVLLVTAKSSPLEGVFIPVYEVTTTASMRGVDLSPYSAIVLNDIPQQDIDTDALAAFIDEGNGVVAFGGRSSYEKGGYKGSQLENLLPVSVGAGEEEGKKFVNVVLLIDISGSTGASFGGGSTSSVEEVEKALAINLISTLRPEDRAGVIAFNTEPRTVAELERVSDNKNQLISRVQRLIWTGSTLISEGLRGARQMLEQADGSKSIVLFSDGKSGSMGEDLQMARFAAEKGIKVYAVGVGEGTDSEHMKEIAAAGRGIYFEPTEAQKLKIIFGTAEEAPTDKMRLEKLSSVHFITRNVKLTARLTGFNQVVAKPNADVLVATAENRPVVSVWRFGLGRIASVTTDDGTGWAAELFNKENSLLLTRTVNWAIGDLGRKKDFDATVRDTFLGEDFSVEVVSNSMPAYSGLEFSKVGERAYSAGANPETAGWHTFFDATAAANYPLELLNPGDLSAGYDPDLGVLAQATGGGIFTPDKTGELLEKVREDSKRLVTSQKSMAFVPIYIALLAFLADIGFRKLMERNPGKSP